VGQLLGSGLSLTRNGQAVKLKPAFSAHLEKAWLPFASQVVDHALMYGFVPVSIEEEAAQSFAAFRELAKKRRPPTAAPDGSSARTLEANEAPSGQPGDPQNATGGGEVVSKAPAPPPQATSSATNLVPRVPLLGTYEIALTPAGRGGYTRRTRVFTTAPAHAYTEDPYVEVFMRSEPDSAGNVVSPLAAAFESVSFVGALKELALTAETIRATPTLVTQSVTRTGAGTGNSSALDAASLFFDAESRAVHQASQEEETSERTNQLGLTVRLAAELNRLRTSNAATTGGGAPIAQAGLPPEIPPRLFALPEKQQLVPGALQPSARGVRIMRSNLTFLHNIPHPRLVCVFVKDLESLMRMANDSVAAALGVPASVIFEVRTHAHVHLHARAPMRVCRVRFHRASSHLTVCLRSSCSTRRSHPLLCS